MRGLFGTEWQPASTCHLGGSPSGSSGSGTGTNANVYTPTAQPAADQNYQDIVRGLLPLALDPSSTPGGQSYQTAQGFLGNYLTANPYAFQGIDAAQKGYDYSRDVLFPNAQTGSSALYGQGFGAMPYASTLFGQGFDPAYGTLVNDILNNSAYGGAQGGAGYASTLGQAGAGSLANAGNQILNTGFDPRNQLFDRTQQQVLDQSNAVNAMSGLSGSPYGAGVTGQNMRNFDIDWQNQQLARQTSAGAAASPLLREAPGLAASSARLPYDLSMSNINSGLAGLNARNAAGIQGASGAGNLMTQIGNNLAGANTLGYNAATQQAGLGGQPYQFGGNVGTNALNALNTSAQLGNSQYILPQQVLNDLQSYLHLGQAASGLSGSLGQMGFNQLASGIGGGLSALNGASNLFGGTGSGGGGLIGGLGGLLGGGGGGGGGLSAGLTGAESLAGFDTLGGTIGMGAADVGGGGASLLSALPFAASA